MAKSVEEITKALKLKAQPKSQLLSIKQGTKKHTLPFESRLLISDQYIFVHVPPTAAIFKVTPGGLSPVIDSAEARVAQLSFRQSRTKSAKREAVEMPEDQKSALSQIPPGYRLGIGADGSPRLGKTRVRKKN